MQESDSDGHLAKRVKLSDDSANADLDIADPVSKPLTKIAPTLTEEGEKEAQVGILAFVKADGLSFQGTLKTRYTDFLVNEILPSGEVLHLKSTNATSLKEQRTRVSVKEHNGSHRQDDVTFKSVEQVDHVGTSDPDAQETKQDVELKKRAEPPSEITNEQKTKLIGYLNEPAVDEVLKLYESILRHPFKKSRDHPLVRTEFTSDRSLRSEIHQCIREVFASRIDSSTDHDGTLVLTAASPNNRMNRQKQQVNKGSKDTSEWRPGKLGWQERGGEYVHFTLYKENRDTMEAISWLTRQLKCNAKNFQFAGTKDRRAVTVQRCSAYRMDAGRLAAQNKTLRNSMIGDFEHKPQGLELGELQGNEFAITLRDCNLPERYTEEMQKKLAEIDETVSSSLRALHEQGFLNYYGLQRFGTFSLRTDTIGFHILKEDLKAACDAILNFSPEALAAARTDGDANGTNVGQDDKNRALAIQNWRDGVNLNSALDLLPRKFSAESNLMRHLQKNPADFYGALMTIQRNLRLMYVHAYQSYIWNMAVTERWKLYRDQVVKGDLVLVHEHKDKEEGFAPEVEEGVDADGEVIIQPEGADRSTQVEDMFERARALTEAEANSGRYTIFDIILPLPGFDVEYPKNESGEFYKTFMNSEKGGGLDPYNMRRKQRDFSLSGGYRKILARIGKDYSYQVHTYTRDEEQFVETDAELMKKKHQHGQKQDSKLNGNTAETGESGGSEPRGDKVAVVLKFQLGSSQYATIALRELSKGGITAHKSDYGGGR